MFISANFNLFISTHTLNLFFSVFTLGIEVFL